MTYPNRALIVAPLARDLYAETGRDVARIPGAANGTSQAWDTIDQDYFVALNDAALTGYGTLQAVPNALRKYILQFKTYTDITATVPRITVVVDPFMGNVNVGPWRRWQDCTVLDFVKTNNGVKTVTSLVGADRPQEWDLLHRWAGNIAETLGAA